jgi:hypothetical protein
MNTCAKLANDDVSGSDGLPSIDFYAAPLALAITTIPARSLSFLMGHGLPSQIDGFDLHGSKMLSVPASPAVILTPFFLEDKNLFLFALLDNTSSNAGARDKRSANLYRPISRGEEDV